jgi:predicted site-specific integrase-resolvase
VRHDDDEPVFRSRYMRHVLRHGRGYDLQGLLGAGKGILKVGTTTVQRIVREIAGVNRESTDFAMCAIRPGSAEYAISCVTERPCIRIRGSAREFSVAAHEELFYYVQRSLHISKQPAKSMNTKHSGRYLAYYRVSTARQGRSGLGLEAQRQAVGEHLNGGNWKLVGEYTEVESGKRSDRPKLAEALKACRLQGAKLIIAKLDRLARNVAFISNLMESKVEFEAVDFPQANRLTIHIMAAIAEHEAKMISDRTRGPCGGEGTR